MAYITITTSTDEGSTMLAERQLPSDAESKLCREHLVERLRWALEDAPVVPSPAEPGGGSEYRLTRQRSDQRAIGEPAKERSGEMSKRTAKAGRADRR